MDKLIRDLQNNKKEEKKINEFLKNKKGSYDDLTKKYKN